MLWKPFDSGILDNSKRVEEAVIWARRYHIQIWIATFELHSEGHVEEMQSERDASFYLARAEDLNVESSYFLLIYIGIGFVELWVFISLQNPTYIWSIDAKRKKFSLKECMNHETPFFTLMQMSF